MDQNLFSRRTFLGGSASLAALAAAKPGRAAASASTITVVQPWEFRSLDPSVNAFVFGRAGITETLVLSAPAGRIEPGLAESWAVSAEGTVWRFRLREDATFHDGTAVTPSAVQASFERQLPNAQYLGTTGIVAIEAEGRDVVFRLREPFGPFLSYLLDRSLPVLAASSFDAAGGVREPVGTGPFRLVDADLPRGLTLARHAAYWGGEPGFAKAQYDAVPNGETRTNIAAAADADLVLNIPFQSVGRVERARAIRLDRVIIPRVHLLVPDCGKPQFADVRTRRALSLAIDRDGIAASIMRNPALAATQYMPPSLPLWHRADLAPHRQDVEQANRLLDEAGWARGADGIRARDGVRFAGAVRTFANRPELPVIATALQSQFRAVGFDLSIQVGEWQAIVEGREDGTLDLGLTSSNLTIVPDPIAKLSVEYTRDEVSGAVDTSPINWRSDEMRRDVATYLSSGDEAERALCRERIAGVLQRELPVIPIVWYEEITAVADRIQGFVMDPFEQRLLRREISSQA